MTKQQYTLAQLDEKANTIRKDIIKMLEAAGSGHSAGPLGLADVFAALYFEILDIRPDEPEWPDRDTFFLSAGHLAPVLYAALAERGYFDKRSSRRYASLVAACRVTPSESSSLVLSRRVVRSAKV